MRPLRPLTAGTMIAAAMIVSLAFTVQAVSAAAGATGSLLRAVEQAPMTGAEKQVLIVQIDAARQAGVPADDLEIIVTRSIERGVGAVTLGSFMDTAAQVERQGLPARPVLDRIEQGLSKGVPQERIDAAAKRLADGLGKAKPLVDALLQKGMTTGAGSAKDDALESVARAGEQGLSTGTMQGLGEKVQARGQSLEQFGQALRTLSFLAGNGIPADAAERTVRASIDRDMTERGYARLERTVNEMVRQGRSIDDIVRAADREVREGRGAGEGRDSGKHDRGTGGGRDANGRTGRGR